MSESLKLSKVLGLERKEPHDPRLCIPEDWKGYNKCVDAIDQLSPDVETLVRVIAEHHSGNYEEGCKIAQEIINKMSEWVVKKGN